MEKKSKKKVVVKKAVKKTLKKVVRKSVIKKEERTRNTTGMSSDKLKEVLELAVEVLSSESKSKTSGVRGVVLVAVEEKDSDGDTGFKIVGGRRRMSIAEVTEIMCSAMEIEPQVLALEILKSL